MDKHVYEFLAWKYAGGTQIKEFLPAQCKFSVGFNLNIKSFFPAYHFRFNAFLRLNHSNPHLFMQYRFHIRKSWKERRIHRNCVDDIGIEHSRMPNFLKIMHEQGVRRHFLIEKKETEFVLNGCSFSRQRTEFAESIAYHMNIWA